MFPPHLNEIDAIRTYFLALSNYVGVKFARINSPFSYEHTFFVKVIRE